jgi:hypothetical protein
MPIIMDAERAKEHNIPTCCGEEMKVAGRWYHCFKCQNKFIRHDGNDRTIITELLNDLVRDQSLLWKDVQKPIHAIWANSYYDEELEKIPDEWCDW